MKMNILSRIKKIQNIAQAEKRLSSDVLNFEFDNTRPEPGSPWPQSPPGEREPPFDQWNNWDNWDNKR